MTHEQLEIEFRILKREVVELRKSFVLPGTEQGDLDIAIGRLDWALSKLILFAKDPNTDEVNKITLENQAEDMIEAGNRILELLKVKKDG